MMLHRQLPPSHVHSYKTLEIATSPSYHTLEERKPNNFFSGMPTSASNSGIQSVQPPLHQQHLTPQILPQSEILDHPSLNLQISTTMDQMTKDHISRCYPC